MRAALLRYTAAVAAVAAVRCASASAHRASVSAHRASASAHRASASAQSKLRCDLAVVFYAVPVVAVGSGGVSGADCEGDCGWLGTCVDKLRY